MRDWHPMHAGNWLLELLVAGFVVGCSAPGPGEQAIACGAGVDVASDPYNCGGCGIACGAGQNCSAGVCVCPAGTAPCSGGCVDVTTNAQNCGSCGITCAAGQSCTNAACQCQAGLSSCDSGCANLQGDGANCGSCGVSCPVGQVCAAGVCAASCPVGAVQCGSSCVALESDPLNCGGCGIQCGGAACVAGQCLPGTGGAGTGGAGSGGVSTGGVPTTGGVSTGGVPTTGGTGGSTCTDVRPTGTEWDAATCDMWAAQTSECSAAWMIDAHYCDASCGRCSGGSGGSSGSGGTNTGGTNTGGTNTGGVPSTCTQPDGQVCSSYQVGTHCGLTYEIWTDTGTACMTNTASGFHASWDQGDGNYLARKGVRPGSTQPVVTYSADYQPNGNSYLAIYGWTQNPLVEYYIVDSWGTWRPPGTQSMGTVQVDGGTYEIYRSERVNMPSIEGTKTFWQYWSVRTEKRTSGTITVAPHFAAWASSGLQMGSFYEVSLVIEGYQSSGNADVTVSFQ